MEFFGIEDYQISLDYDHLPVLQEDILQAGQAYKAKAEGLDVAWKSNMITWNEWRLEQGMDTRPGMDLYYFQFVEKFGLELQDSAFGPKGNPQNNNKKDETSPKDSGTQE